MSRDVPYGCDGTTGKIKSSLFSFIAFSDKKGRRRTVQQTSQMRKSHADSKDKDKKEKTIDKYSGTRSVAQASVHDHSNVRGAVAPSVISERSDSCELPGF